MVFAGTPIEWIVTIFAVLGLVKLVVILTNKQGWWPVVKGVWSRPGLTGFVSLILALVVFWFLLQELTIVQILAVMAFTALLMVLGFMQYSNELLSLAKKMLRKKFSGWLWIYIAVWAFLLLWALFEIFLV